MKKVFVLSFLIFSVASSYAGIGKKESKPPCDQQDSSSEDPNPIKAPKNPISADLIASAGHGEVFDYKGDPIKFSAELVNEIQHSIIQQLWKTSIEKINPKEHQLLQKIMKFVAKDKRPTAEKSFLQAGVIEKLLQTAPKELKRKYEWRHRLIVFRSHDHFIKLRSRFPSWLRDLFRRLGIGDLFDNVVIPTSDDYIERCKAANVPVPPPWSENSSSWKYQGKLVERLILSLSEAYVWTWADPHKRGGCIALPRGSGMPGTAAGIICQSATTGKACFWDNILKTGTTPIGWKNRTLDVKDLKDGDTLSGCMGCHQGNNVFNISPDDTTWKKVINPSATSAIGSTFTTNIENASIPRYIPVSNQGWVNPAAGQCIGCHERPAVGFNPPSSMPPNCKTSNTDPSGCYN